MTETEQPIEESEVKELTEEEAKQHSKAWIEEFKLEQRKKKGPADIENQGFILDSNKVIETRSFPCHFLNFDEYAFGVLLPRWEDYTDKKGNAIGQQQAWRPVVISSLGVVIPVNKRMEEKEYGIKYPSIPHEMPIRWSLESIKSYKDGDAPLIDKEELFLKIKSKYEKYLYFSMPSWYSVNALWDLGTYLLPLFSAYPIKEERSAHPGTAKTKTMRVSSLMAFNGTDILVNPSEASLFRETELLRPTKYIDEAEKLFRNYKGQIEPDNRVELINSSYSAGGVVPREEKRGNTYITKYYHVYSPTRIASIKGLWGATETRSLTQIHTKIPENDQRGSLDPEDDKNNPSWQEIRDECYLFALQNWSKVSQEYKTFSEDVKIKSRDLQLWKPLLVLAKVIGPEVYYEVKAFAEHMTQQRKEDYLWEDTFDFRVLSALRKALEWDHIEDKILVSRIAEAYISYFKKEDEKIGPGFNKSVSSRLDNLGFKPYRDKDHNTGSFFRVSKSLFDQLIGPICPSLMFEQEKDIISPISPISPIIDDNNDKTNEGRKDESV